MTKTIKRIAVLTSGGDAPGMNAAIRAVVRSANHNHLHVYGIFSGFSGMIEGDIQRLENRDVANIIHRGGTILKTARSEAFKTPEGRAAAYQSLQAHGIEGLVIIGGNGSYAGGLKLMEEYDIPVIGLPGTIDNDIYGTDYSIGFDTAINTAVDAVDKIRDTADSHDRTFFIEVMGRHSGYIALYAGLGSGASAIFLPEVAGDIDKLFDIIQKGQRKNKLFNLFIVAEGDEMGGAAKIAEELRSMDNSLDIRVTVIGHLQRGGSPTCFDRILASRMGYYAVEALINGKYGLAIGFKNGKTNYTPIKESIEKKNELNKELLKMAEILSL